MTDNRYPAEDLSQIVNRWGYSPEDNGTMPENVACLATAVVGHRIVKAETGTRTITKWPVTHPEWTETVKGLVLTLDNGTEVMLADTEDCCAYTMLDGFLANPEMVDHVIMGVGTTGGYTTWHIYADWGDVMRLTVDWSPGNPFYYGYGFDIHVLNIQERAL